MRVGIVGLQHESNTFLPTPTTIDSFRQAHLLLGEAVRDKYAAAHHELGGFFAALADERIEAVPVMAAFTMPSGTITAETADELLALLGRELERAGDLDGWLVATHGAAVAANNPDFDGQWLSVVRRHAGPEVPVIGTLDAHANMSERMVAACNALVAYRSNPHLDQRDRGIEAGRLMARTLRGEIHPTMAASFPSVQINIERQLTSASPCREMYAEADAQLMQPGVLSNSILLGFPYADVAEMGSSFLVVTDNDKAQAQRLADDLGAYLWKHRRDFVGQLVSVEQAIQQVAAWPGPTALLDMGDNVGGGSPGDGTLLLEAAIRASLGSVFACLYDPEAAQRAKAAGVYQQVELSFGGKTDHRHGPTLRDTVTVEGVFDGKFSELEVRHGGQTHYDMGATAIVRTSGGQTVMLVSRRVAPFSLAQLTTFGIKPEAYRAIIVKGVHAPVAAYAPVVKSFIRVDTPGVTRADMTKLDFQRRRKPLFPFETAG
jgi:microcystin degradation protein MlrC